MSSRLISQLRSAATALNHPPSTSKVKGSCHLVAIRPTRRRSFSVNCCSNVRLRHKVDSVIANKALHTNINANHFCGEKSHWSKEVVSHLI